MYTRVFGTFNIIRPLWAAIMNEPATTIQLWTFQRSSAFKTRYSFSPAQCSKLCSNLCVYIHFVFTVSQAKCINAKRGFSSFWYIYISSFKNHFARHERLFLPANTKNNQHPCSPGTNESRISSLLTLSRLSLLLMHLRV